MLALEDHIKQILPVGLEGSVSRIVGLTAAVADFPAPLGAVCAIKRESGSATTGEVIGFHGTETLVLPYGEMTGVRRGAPVTLVQSVPGVRVGDRLLGRVLDGRGRYLDE